MTITVTDLVRIATDFRMRFGCPDGAILPYLLEAVEADRPPPPEGPPIDAGRLEQVRRYLAERGLTYSPTYGAAAVFGDAALRDLLAAYDHALAAYHHALARADLLESYLARFARDEGWQGGEDCGVAKALAALREEAARHDACSPVAEALGRVRGRITGSRDEPPLAPHEVTIARARQMEQALRHVAMLPLPASDSLARPLHGAVQKIVRAVL
jgi:hypothetical protein